MNKQQLEELTGALLDFVKRVSEGKATTAEEVQALPAVAIALVRIFELD